MLDLTYDKNSGAELRPARALLTPTWIVALTLLVANDHWLKGSGLVPELVTGKLSDFAGMIVAPVLLATLLGVRRRRALLACHLAVAAVFTGIQLWPAFAAQWSALMGLVGHPWAITCDPSDLIALPFLLLSWALLVPEMDPGKPAMVPIQRTAVAGLSVFGLWSTVATSEVDNGFDPDDTWYQDVYGNVYVNNANDFEIALHIRPLRDDIVVSCDELALDPGRLLTQDAFGEAQHWTLPGRTNVGVDFGPANCSAAWIAGEGIPPVIVFGRRSEYPAQWFPGQSFDPANLGVAGLGVVFGDDGGEWVGSEELLHTPKTDAPELPEECEAPSAESRLDWPEVVPNRDVEILAVEAGVDGCYELEVQELALVDNEILPYGEPYPFYLCVPEVAAPYAVGERLSFEQNFGNAGDRELIVSLLDPETLELAVDDNGTAVRIIRHLRGGNTPDLIGPAFERELVAIPRFSCPWMIEEGCATSERAVDLAVDGEAEFLEPGAPVLFESQAGVLGFTVMLSYARERAIVDLSCSEGSLRLDYDIDFIVIQEPLL